MEKNKKGGNMRRFILLFYIYCASCTNVFPNLITESRNLIRVSQVRHEKADISFDYKKDWTILVYFAADNNLGYFAVRNLMQLLRVGSNARLNIVVQLDITSKQGKKSTFRYFVKKNTLVLFNKDNSKQPMDSGRPETLIDFCTDAIKRFPAHDYMLSLWSHGTGVLDPVRVSNRHMLKLFTFNQYSKLYELDRSISFIDFVTIPDYDETSGICFDDTTKHYLTNQDLKKALDTIFIDVPTKL